MREVERRGVRRPPLCIKEERPAASPSALSVGREERQQQEGRMLRRMEAIRKGCRKQGRAHDRSRGGSAVPSRVLSPVA